VSASRISSRIILVNCIYCSKLVEDRPARSSVSRRSAEFRSIGRRTGRVPFHGYQR
jgi:hypothetical protein